MQIRNRESSTFDGIRAATPCAHAADFRAQGHGPSDISLQVNAEMSDPAVPTVLHAHISKHMLHTHTPTCGVLQAYRMEWQSRGLPHKHMLPPRCVRPAVCSACDAHHRCDVSPSLHTPLTPHISHPSNNCTMDCSRAPDSWQGSESVRGDGVAT
jgi:hypothetical protein